MKKKHTHFVLHFFPRYSASFFFCLPWPHLNAWILGQHSIAPVYMYVYIERWLLFNLSFTNTLNLFFHFFYSPFLFFFLSLYIFIYHIFFDGLSFYMMPLSSKNENVLIMWKTLKARTIFKRLKKDFLLIPEFHLVQFYARLCTQFAYVRMMCLYL